MTVTLSFAVDLLLTGDNIPRKCFFCKQKKVHFFTNISNSRDKEFERRPKNSNFNRKEKFGELRKNMKQPIQETALKKAKTE